MQIQGVLKEGHSCIYSVLRSQYGQTNIKYISVSVADLHNGHNLLVVSMHNSSPLSIMFYMLL